MSELDESVYKIIRDRLMARIDEQFPGGRGITPAKVRALLAELLRELRAEGVISWSDDLMRSTTQKIVGGFAFVLDGDGGDDEPEATVH